MNEGIVMRHYEDDLSEIESTFYKLIPCLLFLEKYCVDNKITKVEASDNLICDFDYENKILISYGELREYSNWLIDINFQNIYGSNYIGKDCIGLSTAIEQKCKVSMCKSYFLQPPYDFDEAMYFQQSTIHYLPPPESYISASNIIKSYHPLYAVYVTVYVDDIINNNLVDSIIDFCKKLEEETNA